MFDCNSKCDYNYIYNHNCIHEHNYNYNEWGGDSMKVLLVVNEKGGVGKTTVTFNTAFELAQQGKRVLMIDLDPQRANLSFMAGLGKEKEKVTMYNVLVEKVSIKKAIRVVDDNLHMVVSDLSVAKISTDNSNLNRFKMALNEIRGYYDYCFIDVPPSPLPGQAHVYAVGSADYIIPVMDSDIMNVEALKGLSETIYAARESVNPNVQVLGILINKYNWRTNLSKQVVKRAGQIADSLDTVVLKTKIRNNVSIAEAVGKNVGITEYDPKSNGAEDIKKLVKELLERMNEND